MTCISMGHDTNHPMKLSFLGYTEEGLTGQKAPAIIGA